MQPDLLVLDIAVEAVDFGMLGQASWIVIGYDLYECHDVFVFSKVDMVLSNILGCEPCSY